MRLMFWALWTFLERPKCSKSSAREVPYPNDCNFPLTGMMEWLLTTGATREANSCEDLPRTQHANFICISIYIYITSVFPFLSVYLPAYLSACLSMYLSTYLSSYPSLCVSIYLSVCLPIYLCACLCAYLSIYLSTYVSTSLPVCR